MNTKDTPERENDTQITHPASVWNVPYRRNPFFTGCEAVLTNLHSTLKSNKKRAFPVALSGLAGIGKSQIAVEYAYRHAKDYPYIFWINATTHDTLNADFVTLATLLNLPEQYEQDQNTILRAVKRWQTTQNGWLL